MKEAERSAEAGEPLWVASLHTHPPHLTELDSSGAGPAREGSDLFGGSRAPLACCNRFNRRLTFTPDHLNGCRCCCHCGLVSYLKKLSHLSSLPPRSLLVVAPRAGLRRLTDHQFHSRLGASAGGNFLKPVPATFNPIAGNKNIADAA